jgi:ubiquinone/menaquinone biosynthesis C-methylase UbiE
MNSSVLPYLASPISHRALEITSTDRLKEVNGDEVFPIIEGIPLLQPPGQSAEWYSECLEVIFQERSSEIIGRISSLAPEERASKLSEVLRNDYGADGVREAIRRYAKLSCADRLRGLPRIEQAEQCALCPAITKEALENRRKLSGLGYSQANAERMRQMAQSWAVHIPRYVACVFKDDPSVIVELGTGAGLGTNALLETGLRSARLITIDVDYACIGNAEGLAKVHNLEESVDGIVGSYWFLPIPDNSVDVVCSHYGIDESRETRRGIEEIDRVLAPRGCFVAVCRTDAAHRLSFYIEQLGFEKQEMREMVWMAGLFPGTDRLVEIAKEMRLGLEKRQTVTPESGHQRDILVFRKGEHA